MHAVNTLRRCAARAARVALNLDRPPTDLALFSGLLTALWGGWILLPWLDSMTTTPTYDLMERLLPEWVWGLLVFGVGIAQMRAVLFGAAAQRARVAMWAFGLWTFMACLFLFSNPAATAHVVYGALGASNAWIYLRERHGTTGYE